MSPVGVRLLRSARSAWPTLLVAALCPTASVAAEAGGGASLPPGAGATEPTSDRPAPALAETESSPPIKAEAPLLPPPLVAVTRRDSDPEVTDLGALTTPSVVVDVGGRLVVTRRRGGLSELVDTTDPANPRILMAGTRTFGTPSGGVDAQGRAVVVLSPCAGETSVTVGGQPPRCPLRAVDVLTARSRALGGTTGALAGDIDGDRVVFTRGTAAAGAQLYSSTGGGGAAGMPLPVTPGAWATVRGTTRPAAGTLRLPALDVAGGRIALVGEYRDGRGRAVAALWVGERGQWRRAAAVATASTGQGSPHVLGPQLAGDQLTAYVEGVVDRPSYLARWSSDGALAHKLSVRRSIGRSTILAGAVLRGDHLIFVDWLPGVPCGSEGAPPCGLRSVGPVRLD